MTKGKKMTKGQIAEAMSKVNNKKSAGAMGQDVINQIATAAERTRVGILESVTAEITALEEARKGAVNAGAPEIPAAFLTAIAAVKADVTKKAWLGFFGVYHQYGIVPRAAAPGPVPVPEDVPEVEVKVELDVPKGPDSPDADKFAKEAAGKIAEAVEEEQAAVDLAAAREKLVKEKEGKH